MALHQPAAITGFSRRSERMEGWKDGRMEGWKDGRMVYSEQMESYREKNKYRVLWRRGE